MKRNIWPRASLKPSKPGAGHYGNVDRLTLGAAFPSAGSLSVQNDSP